MRVGSSAVYGRRCALELDGPRGRCAPSIPEAHLPNSRSVIELL